MKYMRNCIWINGVGFILSHHINRELNRCKILGTTISRTCHKILFPISKERQEW
uniref:Uncharacterized protein n=1 Tax=Nelumbo nucifera TaxID=4432 RepID=A0A822Z8H1_NELNU|nr:TPA_asm: hypothetical protein HUJ06_013982 [Nelumbo nucifera]